MSLLLLGYSFRTLELIDHKLELCLQLIMLHLQLKQLFAVLALHIPDNFLLHALRVEQLLCISLLCFSQPLQVSL